MLLTTILATTASVVCTLATPLNITSMQPLVLNERAAPSVKEGDYTQPEIERIKEGHIDAIKLASMVVSQSKERATFDPIFQKYFQLSDREDVLDVFEQIVGPKDLRHGNSLLTDIVVVKDSTEHGDLACTSTKKTLTQAALWDYDTDKPKLVICPPTSRKSTLGGTAYPGARVITYDTCYPRINTKMNNIGMIMLHEYTHWDKLMSSVMKPSFNVKSASDRAAGCFKTRLENKAIDATKARSNADSYAWFANEVWWTQACVDSHGALTAPTRADE